MASYDCAKDIASRFVQVYYDTLEKNPESAAQGFYKDGVSSVVRPDGTATTVASINDALMPLKHGKVVVEKLNSAYSLHGVISVLVTAWVETKDARKKFLQTFSLAHGFNGYFVVTDMVQYLGEEVAVVKAPVTGVAAKEPAVSSVVVKAKAAEKPVGESPKLSYSCIVGLAAAPKEPAAHVQPAVQKPKPAQQKHKEVSVLVNNLPAGSSKDDVMGMFKAFGRIKQVRVLPAGSSCIGLVDFEQGEAAYNAVQASPLKSSGGQAVHVAFRSSTGTASQKQKQGVSVHVKNLPADSSKSYVYELFKSYGKIKKGERGVYVKTVPENGFCYGFVEFEDLEGAQNAVNASPLTRPDGRRVSVQLRKDKLDAASTTATRPSS